MKHIMMKLAAAATLLLAAALPAGAQSEISPDHFAENSSINAPLQASVQPSDSMKARIATEQAKLDRYEAQISDKARELETEYQAATSNYQDDEAGQMIAYSAHQKEYEELKARLAPQINETRETLARLEQGENSVAASGKAPASHTRQINKQPPVLVAASTRAR